VHLIAIINGCQRFNLKQNKGESESGPALVADHFTCIKTACRLRDSSSAWLEYANAEVTNALVIDFPDDYY